ncbi:MAG: ribonuclease Z [Bacteroidales bacterium]|jgi:ribonuclease Z|nr:ribonuclease Z [Bacteroidales bacterium]
MNFSLMVLGSSAAIPTSNRNLSAHLLNANERFFLIDCGEGTQFQLRKYHISWQRIKYIFISHLHGDHFFGLAGLLNSMHLLGRKNELHLFAPQLLQEILNVQLMASQTTLQYQVNFHPLNMDRFDLLLEEEHILVHSFPLKHSIPTCGFVFREKNPPRKITTPRSYAYCSDTAFSEQIIPWIRAIDLLYHETTFMQDMATAAMEKFHSTAMEAATIAHKAGVSKLLIGHFSARYEDLNPLLDEARSLFPETYLAEEGIFVNI